VTIAKVSPYEAHLIAAADEVIRLRGELRDVKRDRVWWMVAYVVMALAALL
jgi:hypothetical protein